MVTIKDYRSKMLTLLHGREIETIVSPDGLIILTYVDGCLIDGRSGSDHLDSQVRAKELIQAGKVLPAGVQVD